MVRNLDPSTSTILLVGGGTWGSSTALYLARRGYKRVTVLDSYDSPSAISAGNDINKIAEQGHHSSEEDDDAWSSEEVRIEATKAWREDPVFKDYYHETGYVISASSAEVVQRLREIEQPTRERGFVELNNAEDFRRTMPEGVLTGEFPGWKGWYKSSGSGWVHARKALLAATNDAKRLGVNFISGDPEGKVTELITNENGGVKGVKTADGNEHVADRKFVPNPDQKPCLHRVDTILCAGANADQLLDMKDQLRPTAWTLAHIKMTPEEAKLYKNLPVLFNVERGFFMEPDEDNNELKICDEHPGYCNWIRDSQTKRWASVPFAKHEIPTISEQGIRDFLRECMPHLSERRFSFARICWCADTPNRAFLISKHPEHRNLTLAIGDSGHGFMHISVIGRYISDCMEGKLDPRMIRSWRWRPETAAKRDWNDTQGRFGGQGVVMDFQKIKKEDWTNIASDQ